MVRECVRISANEGWNRKEPQIARIFLLIICAIRVLSAPSAVHREWNRKEPLIARISTDDAESQGSANARE
jgi:hypothetical protein